MNFSFYTDGFARNTNVGAIFYIHRRYKKKPKAYLSGESTRKSSPKTACDSGNKVEVALLPGN